MEPESKEDVDATPTVDDIARRKWSVILFTTTVLSAVTFTVVTFAFHDEKIPPAWSNAVLTFSFFGMLGSLIILFIRPFAHDSFKRFAIEAIWLAMAVLAIVVCVWIFLLAVPDFFDMIQGQMTYTPSR